MLFSWTSDNATHQPGRIAAVPGEIATFVRTFDWSRTPLGPTESWPEILVSQVNTLLASKIPMQLLWGSDLTLIYNDAFAPLLTDRVLRGIGQPARVFWHDAWPVVGEQLQRVLDQGETFRFLKALVPILREGVLTEVYWDYTFIPVCGGSGEILGVLDIAQEVTETVQAEKQLDESRTRLQFALDAAGQGTWDYDPTMGTVRGDERMCFLFGMSVFEAPAAAWIERLHPDDRERVAAEFAATLDRGATYDTEYRVLLADSVRWIRAKALAQPRQGTEPYLLGIVEDVTQRKQDDALLRESEKLAAVGRLASSVSHEINNPLASVTNLLYLARSEKPTAKTDEYLDLAERELRRISSITNQTLHFYKQASSPEAVRCDDLFATVIANYQSRIVNSRIRVSERFHAVTPLRCFENEVLQVLSNLVGNALDAMLQGGGQLYLRSREGTRWSTGERGHFLTVADTGTGIIAADLPRIFDPFFSTKGIGGTGLGLWISREAVHRHRGSIYVRSRSATGRSGTAFSVFLPNAVS